MYSSFLNGKIHLSHHSETDLNDSIWVMREFHTSLLSLTRISFMLVCSPVTGMFCVLCPLLHQPVITPLYYAVHSVLTHFDIDSIRCQLHNCDCIIVALYLLQPCQQHVHNGHHVSTHPNITDTCQLQISRKVPVTFPEQLTWCSNTHQRAEPW